jgi:glyoxylate reductase
VDVVSKRWQAGRAVANPVVAVTRPALPGRALEQLRKQARVRVWPDANRPDHPEIVAFVREVDAIVCQSSDRIDADLIAASSRLVAVSTVSVGFDHIDLAALDALGIIATNTPGVLTESTADLTWALILAVARRLVEADRVVHDHAWVGDGYDLVPGIDVNGGTLGIIGFGSVGQAVARRAVGFGMHVIHHSRSGRPNELSTPVTLAELLREADVVSVNVALNAETRGLIGEGELRLMKPTAILVNTSRGAVIDQPALARALMEEWIYGAGLDVTAVEPLPADDPLLELRNCVILPHVGSATVATRSRMAELAVRNVLDALAGRLPAHVLNPQPPE